MKAVVFVARALVVALVSFAIATSLYAQAPSGRIRGTVTDPSGAAVAQATITATPTTGGPAKTVTTNRLGSYEITGLTPGTYNISASANGFAVFIKQNVIVTADQVQTVDISLVIEEEKQQVTVQDEGTSVDVNPAANVSSIVIKGEALEALSDDPDELQSELTALAGPSAGPNGGQFYVDGFTAGQLPPKSSIREIRINQNPFSAEYDKVGYGRIEIFTKPGTNQLHGQFMLDGNDLPFDTHNPFAPELPGYNSILGTGDVTGPMSKKASFTFDFQHRNVNNTGIVNAVVLDPNFNQTPFSQAISNPTTRTVISPRIDYQLNSNNTLTVRYQYWNNGETNEGIGQFSLPTQGYNQTETEHTLQISDTQVVSSRTINEIHFQYLRDETSQNPLSTAAEMNVLGAFMGGGNNSGTITDNQNHFELQNYTSMALNKHFVKFGGRLRAITDSNSSNPNFNGTYTFSSIAAYQATQRGLALGLTPGQILASGGGATQFTVETGTPKVNMEMVDLGVYAEDDWRIRPNLTLSYGLRFETQNDISDHADWAPRLGMAWGIGGGGKQRTPKTVLRAGFGIFYDRFTSNLILQADQLNGINQTEYLVRNPNFFSGTPTPSELTGAQILSTVYRIDPNLHAPYTIQSAASIERQVTKKATVSLTYLNSHGVHQLITNNINSPLPGTYNPANPSSGVRPFPNSGNIYDYESAGIFNQNELIANVNAQIGSKFTLFGFYALNYANSDTGGVATFSDNPYDIQEDYGRAAFAVRDRIFMGGSVALPYGFRLSPFVVFQSGTPFNITVGQDVNGSTILNQRPAFATASTPAQDLIVNQYGAFNIAPTAGEPLIPINYGTGPNQFVTNLRLSKTFGLGKRVGEHAASGPRYGGGGGGRGGLGGRGLTGPGGPRGGGPTVSTRYSLTFSVNARNLFNDVNLAPPVGTLTSPLFGRSNGLSGGLFSFGGAVRRIDLQATFSF